MNIEEIIELLKRLTHSSEVHHVSTVTTFEVTRKEGKQVVTVKVEDEGPNANPQYRYNFTAKTNDGIEITGNGDTTLEDSLTVAQWGKLG
jgi:hypothetical protein